MMGYFGAHSSDLGGAGITKDAKSVMQRRWSFVVRNRDALLPFVSAKRQRMMQAAELSEHGAPEYTAISTQPSVCY